jgi:FlaA1/EpsC-like NDP-sugar epimerase
MGEALNILEMAEDLIILAGYEPKTEVPVIITGLRDGERLHERLVAADETLVPVGEEKILLARSSSPVADSLEQEIEVLLGHAAAGDREGTLEDLSRLVRGFRTEEEAEGSPESTRRRGIGEGRA